jgi:hypothetical protein
MTTGDYSPLLRNGSSRSNITQHHLPISAHYFDITDVESWPVAGLMVLLDNQAQPVRAELHLYDNLDPLVQDAAIRQARLVLQERYLGGNPVPMRILETLQVREGMQVRLPPLGARPGGVQAALTWKPYYAKAIIAVVGLLLLIWLVTALLPSGNDPEDGALNQSPSETPVSEVASEVSAEGETAPLVDEQAATIGAAAALSGGENLPLSRNARADLGIGMRVQIVPGLQLALRSEPGADLGTVLGAMSDGVEATIIGGPEYTRGDSDTIVWWLVELDDGTQAWAAANTSQQSLLMPAP